MCGDVRVALVYEPTTTKSGPCLIAMVNDPAVVEMAARAAIGAAQQRATELGAVDELIGQAEVAEVRRLKGLLRLLVPGLTRTGARVTR